MNKDFNILTKVMLKISNKLVKNKKEIWKEENDFKLYENDMKNYINQLDKNFDLIEKMVLTVNTKYFLPSGRLFNREYKDSEIVSKKWKLLLLKAHDWIPESLNIYPVRKLVDNNLIHTCSINILEPGCYISPHVGPTKFLVRILVIIKTPKNKCWIKVNNKKHIFKKGDIFVFDDTNIHEVKNEGNTDRIALYIDFQRFTSNKITNKIIRFSLNRAINNKYLKSIKERTIERLKNKVKY